MVQHTTGTCSMPDRRCSRELHSLGVPQFSNPWDGSQFVIPGAAEGDRMKCGRSDEAVADIPGFPGCGVHFRKMSSGNARTRARAPALSFMLARANMQMPITKEEVPHSRRSGENRGSALWRTFVLLKVGIYSN